MAEASPAPVPAAVLGLANLPLGLGNGLMLSAVPQLLAARHVPEAVIADVTAAGLLPGFLVCFAAPLLDRLATRRTGAIVATVAAAAAAAAVPSALDRPAALAVLLFALSAAASLNLVAAGGWFGPLLAGTGDEATLGAAMSVAFTAGFFAAAAGAVPFLRAAPEAAPLLGFLLLLPLPLYFRLPAPPRGAPALLRTALRGLFRDRALRRLLLLFALPTGAFALTNTLPGLGAAYGASERLVGLLNGAVVTATGIAGALLVPPLVRRVPAARAYLAVGGAGAAATAALAALPHTPATFAVAMVGENLAQAVTLTVVTVAALELLAPADPLAATRFGLLTAVPQLPVAAMQWLDGQCEGAGGLAAMYLADGGLGLFSCLAVLPLFRRGRDGAHLASRDAGP